MTGVALQSSRHTPLPLGEVPSPEVLDVARDAQAGRLVIYAGAGLSMADPAAGPTGAHVAERLRPYVAELLGVSADEVSESDLESLAARVENAEPHRLPDLKVRAAGAGNFLDMDPNYGHEAAVLLLREGVLKMISVNWDRGVENAGLQADVLIESVASPGERQRLGTQLPLFKVHGCASRPATLAVTRAEVDKPQDWARAEVQQALAGGTVVFLGLGTVGLYVSEPLDELTKLWDEDGVTIRVVDPGGLSNSWKTALGEKADDAEIPLAADRFLDDLVRAIVLAALSSTHDKIREIQDGTKWSEDMLAGCDALRTALTEASGNAVLRWWRDGVAPTLHGNPFVLEHPGQQSLMAIALLIGRDGDGIEVGGTEDHLAVRSEQRYFEIVFRPGRRFADIDRSARERIRRRSVARVYEPGRPVFVAVHGGIGTFPAVSAHPDVAAPTERPGEIGEETSPSVHLVMSELAVTGQLAA